ncbi:MAG: hypothetical protein H0V01_14560 [Bacteroidetes bacterium]|nr:hypothetical protein [Bacteroidota bacterium]HET6242906.1 hypothetical protein [Bacteroidia bacterium]
MQKPREGKQWLEKSLLLSTGIGSNEIIKTTFEALTKNDSALGNYKSALGNYKMFILYRDSLINEENTRATIQQQMQYEFDKKEALLKEEQVRQTAIAEEESKRQRLFLILVGSIGIAVAVIAGIVFRSLRITRMQKSIIEKQKHLVEVKQKEILDSIHYAKRIQQSLLPTENYIGRNLKKLKF